MVSFLIYSNIHTLSLLALSRATIFQGVNLQLFLSDLTLAFWMLLNSVHPGVMNDITVSLLIEFQREEADRVFKKDQNLNRTSGIKLCRLFRL